MAQDRQLEVIGVEPKLPSILAAVAQHKLGVSSRVEVVLYVFRFRKDKDWMAACPSGPAAVRASGPKLLTTPSKPTGKMRHKMASIIAAGM